MENSCALRSLLRWCVIVSVLALVLASAEKALAQAKGTFTLYTSESLD